MSSLHISKVAVGCASLETLRKRQLGRLRDGFVPITTRFRPKRAEDLVGGSVFWIVKHRITARQRILGFAEGEDRRTVIRLDPELVQVCAYPKRAHQGWRYLNPADAPGDFDGLDEDGSMSLPPLLLAKLSALALV
jgi:hypothetical protein